MDLLRCFPSRSKHHARCLSALLALGLTLLFAPETQAQTETVIYSFQGAPDGEFPLGFVRNGVGNIYGTTEYGGTYNQGEVFEISGHRRLPLYSFTGKADGGFGGALLRDAAGNLYGVTSNGGDLTCLGGTGCGTVFKLDTTGKETVLHSFTESATDGGNPLSLVEDRKGNLYGATEYGGSANVGTIFKLDAAGNYSTLYSFTGGSGGADGANPNGVILDGRGNLFGTTSFGGPGNVGTVFKIDSTGKETVLFTFSSNATGENPQGGLVRDPAGNLYGTTQIGGTSASGTIFKIDPSGKETILHSFSSANGDGGNPQSTLTRDAAGNLYGSTALGGVDDWGVVFKLDTAGNETILHSFGSGTDGRAPAGQLVLDNSGHIWGVTQQGGTAGCGTVFEIAP
jgi:uncharacterized repeat protein (TIGR03803 family)